MNIDIKILQPGDLDAMYELIKVFETVFEMDHFRLPGNDHLQKLLNAPSFRAVVASIEGRIVGGLTVYVLDQYYSEKPLAYIYDLAVLSAFQRKGIGRQLIAFTKDHFGRAGFEEVFVQADSADRHAVDFYRSTGPVKEESVVHFYYTL